MVRKGYRTVEAILQERKIAEMKVEEKILYLQDRYSLRDTWTNVTVRIQKWIYHGPRVALAIVEGYYNTSEEIDKVLERCEKDSNHSDCPKHLEIICRPGDMLKLANALTEICK
jgi:hypothetical protein